MKALTKGRYLVRLADSEADLAAVLALRGLCFRGDAGARDEDGFDPRCLQVMIEDARSGRLCCTFRLLPLSGGAEIGASYSAQYYDVTPLEGFEGPMVEMGRFCIHPDLQGDPHILRAAWAGMTTHVDEYGVELLFGCSSFKGTEAEAYMDAFALLRERHLAPRRWLPRVKAPQVFRFAKLLRRKPDPRRAFLGMPPLLRSYLMLGGWVSDHAVVDADLGTLHVFTGLEIRAVPPARAKALRATV
ncbi:GNAT family N-acetyltransferase [Vannielia litorea]|uniref:L-ornithine N(alpha)-acyltransferase n=1 Tax=Vannielia litorea TaxID=1217970 RepID=A0A1N6FAJ2_9RHOB|nr:GNAT family N-acyltransferase [Vannielia litorea]SIN92289.1 ornithine-acyl[acyl carrier protein] N-acyltransferase [Vannielia litorea]